jgi:hypothetical protein
MYEPVVRQSIPGKTKIHLKKIARILIFVNSSEPKIPQHELFSSTG